MADLEAAEERGEGLGAKGAELAGVGAKARASIAGSCAGSSKSSMCGFGARLRKVTTGLRCTTNSETTEVVSASSTSAARCAATSCVVSIQAAFGPASAR